MQMQTLRRSLSTLRPFSHLVKSKKLSPRDSGPNDDVDEKEKKSGPTNDNDDDDLDAGPEEENDDLETKPNDAEDSEKDDEAVKKARVAGHARALRAVARQARRAERTRCASIFGSRHAQGRVEQPANLAFRSLLSASAAITALSRTPLGQSTDVASTPGARLMAATLALADKQLGHKTPATAPVFAAERARFCRFEDARLKLRAAGGTRAGERLLAAMDRLPPPKNGFGY